MARVRLFGPARTAFGRPECELAASDLDELVRQLAGLGGAGFADLLGRCALWVNGEPPEPGAPLRETDEVAVLPPVSGGAR